VLGLRLAYRFCRLPVRVMEHLVDRVYGPAMLWARGVRCGKGLRLYGAPVVRREATGTIVLGDQVSLYSRPLSNWFYLARPCTLVTGAGARIAVGDGVARSGATLVAVAAQIEIGERTMIGAEAIIMDSDAHPLDPRQRARHPTAGAVSRPVRIGRDVFIGARAIVLKGVTVGDGAVIGAGAVVSSDVAAGDIVVGNPARRVRSVLAGPAEQRGGEKPLSSEGGLSSASKPNAS
jgi:acetyltransferase-like isoleucine patch superfamily enzyme